MPPAETLDILIRARDKASPIFKRLTRSLKLLGGIAGIGGVVAVGIKLKNVFEEALKSGAAFEQEMAAVGAIAQTTTEQTEALSDAAKQMGKTTVFSATEAANAERFLSQAGLQVTQTLKALEPTLRLAAAGEIALGQAAQFAATITKGLNRSFEDLTETVDILAFTASSSNTDVTGIATSMSLAATSASLLGIEIDELAVGMGLLADRGLDASRIGSGLNRAFAILAGQLEADEKGLKGFNVELFDAKGKFVGLAEAIRRMNEAGIRGAQAFDIFGTRAGQAMAILLELGPVALEEMTVKQKETLASMAELGGFADVQMRRKLNNLNGDVRLLAAAWEGLSITLFTQGSPAMRAITQQLTLFVNAMDDGAEGSEDLARLISGAIELISLSIQAAIPIVALFGLAFLSAKAHIEGFVAFLSDQVSAIGALLELTAPTKKMRDFGKQVRLIASGFGDDFREGAEETFSSIDRMLKVFEDLFVGMGNIRERSKETKDAFIALADSATPLTQEQADIVAQSFDLMFDAAEKGSIKLEDAFRDAGDSLIKFVKEADEAGLDVSKRLREMAREAAKTLAGGVSEGVDKVDDETERLLNILDTKLIEAGRISQRGADKLSGEILKTWEASTVPIEDFVIVMGEELTRLVELAENSNVRVSAAILEMARTAREAATQLAAGEPLAEDEGFGVEEDEEEPEELPILLDEEEAERALETLELLDAFAERMDTVQVAALGMSEAVSEAFAGMVDGTLKLGGAAKKMISGLLRALAQKYLVRAAEEIAEALAALARYDFGGAAAHFGSAAKWSIASGLAIGAASRVGRAARGTIVGGEPGIDRNPFLLSRDEIVVDPTSSRSILSGRAALVGPNVGTQEAPFVASGGSGGSGGGISVGTLILNLSALDGADARELLSRERESILEAIIEADDFGEG